MNTADAADVDATPVSIDVPDGYEPTQASQVTGENLTEPDGVRLPAAAPAAAGSAVLRGGG